MVDSPAKGYVLDLEIAQRVLGKQPLEIVNLTRARWVLVRGPNGADAKAGVVLMSHPKNHDHPEHLHTWDPGARGGGVFANFNPVQNESLTMRPRKVYARRYRLFVFDGEIDADEAERLWKEWAAATAEVPDKLK